MTADTPKWPGARNLTTIAKRLALDDGVCLPNCLPAQPFEIKTQPYRLETAKYWKNKANHRVSDVAGTLLYRRQCDTCDWSMVGRQLRFPPGAGRRGRPTTRSAASPHR